MSLNRRINTATGATLLSVLVLLTSFFGSARPTYAAEPITVGGKVVVVNTDGDTIRMRGGAGTGYDQVGEAYEGQVLSVLEGPERDAKSYRWFRVKGPNGTGWIVAGYLEGKAGTAPAPAKPITKAATDSAKQTAKPAASAAKIVGFGKVANTDGDPLRVRNAANRQGSVLSKLAPNTVVAVKKGPVTDDEGIAWYQVSANGVTGWAMAQYLVQSQASLDITAAKLETKAETGPAQAPAAQVAPAVAPAAAPAAAPAVAKPAAIQPPVAASGKAGTIVSTAMLYVGYRYRYGGTTPSGFDCSGFVYYVLNKSGVRMSRNMEGQLASGPRVSTKDLQPGDLVFFSNTYKRGLSHAGIYIGNGRFVHAENERTGVRVSDLWSAYWGSHFTAAVRPTK
ncbi:MAG TPA: SH3 domain-containing C40 family peptidase [Chloroflexia bacterium]|nr:SH3 domain-containing C40 family peptidase [Chloroflexia bacterium]